ncbi:hypothetical protein M9458_005828, partial [Cirrhinus mrigala]
PERNHNPWMLLYFISFLLIVSFFVLNMFVGVVVENFHKGGAPAKSAGVRRITGLHCLLPEPERES